MILKSWFARTQVSKKARMPEMLTREPRLSKLRVAGSGGAVSQRYQARKEPAMEEAISDEQRSFRGKSTIKTWEKKMAGLGSRRMRWMEMVNVLVHGLHDRAERKSTLGELRLTAFKSPPAEAAL